MFSICMLSKGGGISLYWRDFALTGTSLRSAWARPASDWTQSDSIEFSVQMTMVARGAAQLGHDDLAELLAAFQAGVPPDGIAFSLEVGGQQARLLVILLGIADEDVGHPFPVPSRPQRRYSD
jgi:hypothetical protein